MFALPNLFGRNRSPRPQTGGAETASPEAFPAEARELLTAARPRPVASQPVEAGESSPLDAVIAKWREALGTQPNSGRIHLRLGVALYEKGEYEEALIAFRKAARLGQEAGLSGADCGLAHCGLGCALLQQSRGYLEIALPEFRKAVHALNTTPDFAPPSLTQGLALYAQGQHEEAIAALRQTLCLGPEDGLLGTDPALAHCALGCALIAQDKDDLESAFVEFQRAFCLLCLARAPLVDKPPQSNL
ncbi:MAG TPA: tetratricopeptide repeat protein [Chthonomonadaceae bacterium]|nr:tetratricopeptide repeat protein [Chthonomonadaceae bacterium]